jgi:hypothetical protein
LTGNPGKIGTREILLDVGGAAKQGIYRIRIRQDKTTTVRKIVLLQ